MIPFSFFAMIDTIRPFIRLCHFIPNIFQNLFRTVTCFMSRSALQIQFNSTQSLPCLSIGRTIAAIDRQMNRSSHESVID